MKKIKLDGTYYSFYGGISSNIEEVTTKKEIKKIECKKKILSKYSKSDQINILMSGDSKSISEMNSRIQSVLEEYRTKGKDADFSNIN